MVKICRGCQKELPLSEYYGHPQMPDGHLNYCKDCVKAKANAHRANNIEKIREYDRARGKLPHRLKRAAELTRRKRKEIPGYNAAHMAVDRAIKAGKIIKPRECMGCGCPDRLEAHHYDYSKPLEVSWLCSSCHTMLHLGKTEKAEQLRQKYKLPLAN